MSTPSPASPPIDPVTVVLRLPAGERAAKLADTWAAAVRKFPAGSELVAVAEGDVPDLGAVRVLRNDGYPGIGACLRLALPTISTPLVAVVESDYPYQPADLGHMLERIAKPSEVYGVTTPVSAVTGVRTGRPVPAAWAAVGTAYRLFCRVALAVAPKPVAGWLGFREHVRSWWLWVLMGVPIADPNCGLKLFRRELFDRFPVQTDGAFALPEIFAKLTFLRCVVDEEPLAPSPEPVPSPAWTGFGTVLRDGQFTTPEPVPAG